ncbi:unnamed protein product [Schistosoma curassoni]|uniref:GATA zinc finger domain-containing protein 14-like n=1 Tax=Schistosoma curassoni TaxID=6186 RepID=A0A183JD26_9TREM|nr:unnamed protein product [Schistosoma curassoni]
MNYRQEYTHKHVIPLISQSNLWFPDISKPQRSSLATLNHNHNNNNYHYYQTYDFNKKPHNQYFNSSLITTQQQSIRSKYKLDLFNNISKRSLIQINNKQTIQSIKIRKHLYNNNHNNNTVDLNEQYTYYQLSVDGNNRRDTFSRINTIHCESIYNNHDSVKINVSRY